MLFYNGGILYYLHDHLQYFFETLGLTNKFVTGPLWRLLESGIHILDLNEHYPKMRSLFFDLFVDAREFMLSNVIFFENIEISKNNFYNSFLLLSDILDEPTKQCLDIIFGSLCIVTRRMLHDHLKNGKYANPCEQLYKETVSVSTTNSIAEHNFGMIDKGKTKC